MENILFEYPVNDENRSFDDEFQVQKARANKIKYTVIIAVLVLSISLDTFYSNKNYATRKI